MKKFKWAYYSIKGEVVQRTDNEVAIRLIAPGEQGYNPCSHPWMTDRLKEVFFKNENIGLTFTRIEYNNIVNDDVTLYFDIYNKNW
jgi:hypothetical protein